MREVHIDSQDGGRLCDSNDVLGLRRVSHFLFGANYLLSAISCPYERAA